MIDREPLSPVTATSAPASTAPPDAAPPGTAPLNPVRPLRADARRNRERVLAAARESFASDGPDVPLDLIAERAGVGAGTVHRHFPTKESLVAAVVTDRLAGLAARAGTLADAADPAAAFRVFIRELTAEARHNVTLSGVLGGAGIGPDGAAAAAALSGSLGRLLERAQRAGGVRADLTVPDLHAILGGVIAMERGLSAGHQGIGLDIVIDGLAGPRTT